MIPIRSKIRACTLIAALVAATAAPGLAGLLTDDGTVVLVVINHEEQYSVLPVGEPVPKGWKAVGKTCRKSECLEYIDEVWTDMRPQSIKQFVDTQLKKHMKSK